MQRYTYRFWGRVKGALGVHYKITTAVVEAESEEKASLKLYDTYEHISVIGKPVIEDIPHE